MPPTISQDQGGLLIFQIQHSDDYQTKRQYHHEHLIIRHKHLPLPQDSDQEDRPSTAIPIIASKYTQNKHRITNEGSIGQIYHLDYTKA